MRGRAGGVSPLILRTGKNQGANAPRSPFCVRGSENQSSSCISASRPYAGGHPAFLRPCPACRGSITMRAALLFASLLVAGTAAAAPPPVYLWQEPEWFDGVEGSF